MVANLHQAVACLFGLANIASKSSPNSQRVGMTGLAGLRISLIFNVAQGPVVPPFIYDTIKRTLLQLSGNSVCLMLRYSQHSALKLSRLPWVPMNGVEVPTLGVLGRGVGMVCVT